MDRVHRIFQACPTRAYTHASVLQRRKTRLDKTEFLIHAKREMLSKKANDDNGGRRKTWNQCYLRDSSARGPSAVTVQ